MPTLQAGCEAYRSLVVNVFIKIGLRK